jgi:hypothetical protein
MAVKIHIAVPWVPSYQATWSLSRKDQAIKCNYFRERIYCEKVERNLNSTINLCFILVLSLHDVCLF